MPSRAQLWTQFERALALLTLVLLLGVPGLSKLFGPYPPAWFAKKFDDTIINLFPGALSSAFVLILVAELLVPLVCLVALARREYRVGEESLDTGLRWADFGFVGACLLLLALTFGSLVAKDYDNAFQDFGYLIGVLYLRNRAFPVKVARGDGSTSDA